MNFRTGYSRAAGLGPAGHGTHHWWMQRVSSVVLLPLTVAFVYIFGSALGTDYETARAAIAHPFNAIVTVLFLIAGFHHLQQGLQVVIEDYVHARAMLVGLLTANLPGCWCLAIVGIFAVVRISLGS